RIDPRGFGVRVDHQAPYDDRLGSHRIQDAATNVKKSHLSAMIARGIRLEVVCQFEIRGSGPTTTAGSSAGRGLYVSLFPRSRASAPTRRSVNGRRLLAADPVPTDEACLEHPMPPGVSAHVFILLLEWLGESVYTTPRKTRRTPMSNTVELLQGT